MANDLFGGFIKTVKRAGAVLEHRAQGTGAHVLETQCQHTVCRAGGHGLACQEQRGRAGRTVVVEVHDRDTRHADFVHRALACRRIAIDIADIGLLHHVVRDTGVRQGLTRGFGRHVRVRFVLAGFGEGDHAHTGD